MGHDRSHMHWRRHGRGAQDHARQLLSEHREELDRLVDLLLERETADGEDVYAILGRPMPGRREEAEPAVAHATSEIERD